MVIGVNWKAIWKPVWKAVWTQVPPSPTPSPAPAPTVTGGGFFYAAEMHRLQRRRRLEEERRREEEADEIQAKLDREIAKLLREQEERDAERRDLERIQALADEYAGRASREGVPRSVTAAILRAQEERTFNALQQMQREIDRMFEEEEAHISALLLLDDD